MSVATTMGLRESVVSISAGATQKLVSANPARRYLRIQNTGSNAAVLGLTSTVNASGAQLAAGVALTFDAAVPTGELYATATAATTISVLEGV